MAGNPLGNVLRQLRKWIDTRTGSDVSDDDLLERFVTQHDENAFEAIVRRHGPLVLGVCRRWLFDSEDVEDAFQATFLVLVRKAASIRCREQLGNWLYGVALRIARRLRAGAARGASRQRPLKELPASDPPPDALRGELRAVLDEEVQRLPEKYRVPFLLCYLEGRTNDEAARALGCSRGTVATRLARARQRLRRWLSRRGLDPSAGVMGTILAGEAAEAAVSEAVLTSTVQLAVQVGTGRGVATPPVVALVEGVLRDMFLTRCKVLTVLTLALLLGASGAVLGYHALAAGVSQPQKNEEQKVPPKEGDPSKAATGWQAQTSLQVAKGRVEAFTLSPDGKYLVSVGHSGLTELKETKDFKELFGAMNPRLWYTATGKEKGVFKWDAKATQTDVGALAFSPDGATLASSSTGVALWDVEKMKIKRLITDKPTCSSVVFAPDGKALATLRSDGLVGGYYVGTGKLKKSVRVYKSPIPASALSPDGRSFSVALAFSSDGKKLTTADAYGVVKVWDLASGKMKTTQTIKTANPLVLAPDGSLAASVAVKGTIEIWDLATRKRQSVLEESIKGSGKLRVAFAPDGKSLASGGPDGTVSVWDLPSQKNLAWLTGHKAAVNGLVFAADGKVLATTDEKGVAFLWVLK
jgi:RNA polymerase sigma factor (sigma-70 family)